MSSTLGFALCAFALFTGGWLAGFAQSEYQHNAATWKTLTTFEKVLSLEGFHQGYSTAADAKELLRNSKITGPKRALVETMDRDLLGDGLNKRLKVGELASAVSTFYGDYRNASVCWNQALTLSSMATNGDTVTDQMLNDLRALSAKSGCR
jgi:hypothetical protein